MSFRASQARSLAIIGAGAGGLSAARLLKDQGYQNITIFEAQDRVGGKALSLRYGGALHEMGTCYSTLAHRRTNAWMRELGIKQRPLGLQFIDGIPFMDFVRTGPGPSLASEGLRYLDYWRIHQAASKFRRDDTAFLEEAALPLEEWLSRHRFVRLRRFMLRAMTAMGYGRLNDVTVLQAMRWCTPGLIFSGLLNQVKMPEDGWQNFWDRLSASMDVRPGAAVSRIERLGDRVIVHTAHGDHSFTHVLISTPLDSLSSIMDLTEDERWVSQAMQWGGYVTTLFRAQNWFPEHQAHSISRNLQTAAKPGSMLGARRVPAHPDADPVYLSGQYADGLSSEALIDQLKADVTEAGAHMGGVIRQSRWQYFPRYRPEAIRAGLLKRMDALQGVRRTWYTGASFSHEAVSNIVAFNERLVPQIVRELTAPSPSRNRSRAWFGWRLREAS